MVYLSGFTGRRTPGSQPARRFVYCGYNTFVKHVFKPHVKKLIFFFVIFVFIFNISLLFSKAKAQTSNSTPTPTPAGVSDYEYLVLCGLNFKKIPQDITEEQCIQQGGKPIGFPPPRNPYIYVCCSFETAVRSADGCIYYEYKTVKGGYCAEERQACTHIDPVTGNKSNGQCYDWEVCDKDGNVYKSCECLGENIPYCGNDVVNKSYGEECDPPFGLEGCTTLLTQQEGYCNKCCKCVSKSQTPPGEIPCSERPVCSGNCTTSNGQPGGCVIDPDTNTCWCSPTI